MAGMAAGREFTFLWWVATLFCRAPKACDGKKNETFHWTQDSILRGKTVI